jgi:hypothetical protein
VPSATLCGAERPRSPGADPCANVSWNRERSARCGAGGRGQATPGGGIPRVELARNWTGRGYRPAGQSSAVRVRGAHARGRGIVDRGAVLPDRPPDPKGVDAGRALPMGADMASGPRHARWGCGQSVSSTVYGRQPVRVRVASGSSADTPPMAIEPSSARCGIVTFVGGTSNPSGAPSYVWTEVAHVSLSGAQRGSYSVTANPGEVGPPPTTGPGAYRPKDRAAGGRRPGEGRERCHAREPSGRCE